MTFDNWELSDAAAAYAGHYVLLSEDGQVVLSHPEGDSELFHEQLPQDAYARNLAGFVEPTRVPSWPLKDTDDETLRALLFALLEKEQDLTPVLWGQAAELLNEICVREGVLPMYEVVTDPTSRQRPVRLGYRLNALEIALPEPWNGYADRDEADEDAAVPGTEIEGFEWLQRTEATYQRMYIDLLLAAGSDRGLRYGSELLVDERGRFSVRYGSGGRVYTPAEEARLHAALAAGATVTEPLPTSLYSLQLELHYGAIELHNVAGLLEQVTRVDSYLGCWWAPFEGQEPVEHTTEIVYSDAEKQVAIHTSAKETVKVLTFHDRPNSFSTVTLARDRSEEDAQEAERVRYLYEKLCLLAEESWPRPESYEYPVRLPCEWAEIPADAGEFDQVRVLNWGLLREQLTSYREEHPELELRELAPSRPSFY